MNQKQGLKCMNCSKVHYDLTKSCCPEIVVVWTCGECGTKYEMEQQAESCCSRGDIITSDEIADEKRAHGGLKQPYTPLDESTKDSVISAIVENAGVIFVACWDGMSEDVHALAVEKGWWVEDRNDGEIIALIHSELSEALEAMRHDDPRSDKIPGFSSVEEELADAVIRILDYACIRGHRVGEAIVAKHEFNMTRPYKHGKKF